MKKFKKKKKSTDNKIKFSKFELISRAVEKLITYGFIPVTKSFMWQKKILQLPQKRLMIIENFLRKKKKKDEIFSVNFKS